MFNDLFGSAEYQNTGSFVTAADHSNPQYLKMLYVVILQRQSDVGGFNFWLGVANTGGSGLYFNGDATLSTRITIEGNGTPGEGFVGSAEFQSLFQ